MQPRLCCGNPCKGFTLTELLTASAILGIFVSMAWGTLLLILEAENKQDAEFERQQELNRAVDFIADDVHSASQLSTVVTLPGPEDGLFELVYPDGSKTAYFVVPKEARRWRGPYLLLRRSSSMSQPQPLVDGLSDRSPLCTSPPGEVVQASGVKVVLQGQGYLQVCLAGLLPDNQLWSASRQVMVRGGS
ncbi:PulJ/GspJ family protein [Lyngbya confervoides]|uniref:Prepilin-type N-terminal cleavage/methylation domain-containing protein n=1 Tax=Lyngbya confervoides BDU141951 TaxID=1574623 RepID=A0ABD4T4C0_9CYAN|nr:prepilin-type N-terminal cleavage/methylation domain-containing protein [Lyngbya confervoides]MCM1983278.1 prepilin-type N-terminal cleavage/methylation domain-containing protein [Lyngbya confervoides BDU141951]